MGLGGGVGRDGVGGGGAWGGAPAACGPAYRGGTGGPLSHAGMLGGARCVFPYQENRVPRCGVSICRTPANRAMLP